MIILNHEIYWKFFISYIHFRMNNREHAVLHVSFITFWAVIYIHVLYLWITSSWEGWGQESRWKRPSHLETFTYTYMCMIDAWHFVFVTKTAPPPFYRQEKYPGVLRRNLFVFNLFLRCVGSQKKRHLKLQTSKL